MCYLGTSWTPNLTTSVTASLRALYDHFVTPVPPKAAPVHPTDRGKPGQKRCVLVDGHDLPTGVILSGANRHDSPLLRPTLERLSRFGFFLPETMRVESGCDSSVTRDLFAEFGCGWEIYTKGTFIEINHTRRWTIERTNSWRTRGFGLLQVVLDRADRVQQMWASLANAVIVLKRLRQMSWTKHRWVTRPVKRYDWR
ncbi:MAG: transposase [Brevibacterium linens]